MAQFYVLVELQASAFVDVAAYSRLVRQMRYVKNGNNQLFIRLCQIKMSALNRSIMSLTNLDITVIKSNPINNLIGERMRVWTCKHKGTTIVDEQNWIYKCCICFPCGGPIRVIPNEQTISRTLEKK